MDSELSSVEAGFMPNFLSINMHTQIPTATGRNALLASDIYKSNMRDIRNGNARWARRLHLANMSAR